MPPGVSGREAPAASERAATESERLRAALGVHGLALTAQRRVVFRELSHASDHPTAEELFLRLRPELPELSLGTVYKCLHLFSHLSLARAVPTPDGKARFEARMEPHHHVRCARCGILADLIDPRLDPVVPEDLQRSTGFVVDQAEVLLTGVCQACQAGTARVRPARRGSRRGSAPRSRRN